jgi:hypothetical protein
LMVRLVLLAYASGPRSIVRADGFPTRTIMHIITMTKQHTSGRSESAPAIAGDGAPAITPQLLAEAIRQSLAECYSDRYQFGSPPRETIVCYLISGVVQRVFSEHQPNRVQFEESSSSLQSSSQA